MVGWMNIKQAQEERCKLAQEMRKVVEEVGAPENWTPELNQKFDKMDADLRVRDAHIDKLKKLETITPVIEDQKEHRDREDFAANPRTADETKITHRDRDLAFRAFSLGPGHARPEMLRAAEKCQLNWAGNVCRGLLLPKAPRRAQEVVELRATSDYLAAGTAAYGGNIVPNAVMQAMETWMVAWGGVRQAARVIRTETGGNMPIPTVDDTATTAIGAILAENTATTIHSMVFGQVVLSAYKYTSRLVGVSIELLQDANFDIGAYLGEALGTRIGRAQNLDFTRGETSDSHPQGFSGPSSNSGKTGVTSSTYNQLIYSEVVDLLHSVDPAYRGDPSCRWMMNDMVLGNFRKLVDSYARPLWLPTIVGDAPDRILGYPYTINQDMCGGSTAAAFWPAGTKKTIAYGAFNRYIVRDVMGVELLRLNERYAEQGSVAFLAFARSDGDLINRDAIKVLAMASSS